MLSQFKGIGPIAFCRRQGRHFLSVFSLYCCGMLLVGLWWALAFKEPRLLHEQTLKSDPKQPSRPSILSLLSPLKRDILQEALSGDFSLMTKLIAEWDIDAQFLEGQGLRQVQRLPRSSYVQAQLFGRQLKKSTPQELTHLRNARRKLQIYDDTGRLFSLGQGNSLFLPQTYVAATFMLALTSPENIVAIPRGLREQTTLFPKHLTDRISLDIDRFNSEKLFKTNPGIAFVAHYSHPNTMEALQGQGIKLFTLKDVHTVQDIQESLACVGHVINRPIEADLLNLFIEASLMAIDNRMLALNLKFDGESHKPRVLFLHYHGNYSMPGSHSITSQLLGRIGADTVVSRSRKWMVPILKEQIVNLNPDCLIIATAPGNMRANFCMEDPAFQNVTAVKECRTFLVDDTIQQSPTQFVVLAYYDLFSALAMADLRR